MWYFCGRNEKIYIEKVIEISPRKVVNITDKIVNFRSLNNIDVEHLTSFNKLQIEEVIKSYNAMMVAVVKHFENDNDTILKRLEDAGF
jgi:hypothetical protein